MHLKYRNVNEAFASLVGYFNADSNVVRRPSRNGNVLMIPEPVTITYRAPTERVLFNQGRDCNPFFHLFESLWMLAGRSDVKPLLEFNPKMADYSDNGETLSGAYGHRWRRQFGGDQLACIIDELKRDPESRRCVLEMWEACSDLGTARVSKDKPCNTHAYFSVRSEPDGNHNGTGPGSLLDMTVCNRSNDLIWGMLGANVVHFSMLQEYMAKAIGVGVGYYHQVTNNLHVYEDKWQPSVWIDSENRDPPLMYGHNVYGGSPLLVDNVERFDEEVQTFIDYPMVVGYEETFLKNVAQPMVAAFRAHKQRRYFGDQNALEIMTRVWAGDWRIAGENWIKKRMEAWRERNDSGPYLQNELERTDEETSAE